MRTIIIIIGFLLGVSAFGQQGVNFEPLTFEEALAKAKTENRWIFVDAYTVWCGPCKQMADKVFTQEKVGTFFNNNFINVKYDMEKGEGPELAKKLGVGAYPTFVMIKPDGTLHHKMVGGMEADVLMDKVRKAQQDTETIGALAARYEAGERDKQFLSKYLGELLLVSEMARIREVAGILGNSLTDAEKVLPAYWNLFSNDDLAKLHSANSDYLHHNKSRFYETIGREKVEKRFIQLYTAALSTIVWGRDTKSSVEDVRKMEKDIKSLRLKSDNRLGVYVRMAQALKAGDTGKLLLLCEKEFSRFNDGDIMTMVMPVSVYFRSAADKQQMAKFIAAGKTIIPNLETKENKDYINYYFTELEKQL